METDWKGNDYGNAEKNLNKVAPAKNIYKKYCTEKKYSKR